MKYNSGHTSWNRNMGDVWLPVISNSTLIGNLIVAFKLRGRADSKCKKLINSDRWKKTQLINSWFSCSYSLTHFVIAQNPEEQPTWQYMYNRLLFSFKFLGPMIFSVLFPQSFWKLGKKTWKILLDPQNMMLKIGLIWK